jgi:hypothetical protein
MKFWDFAEASAAREMVSDWLVLEASCPVETALSPNSFGWVPNALVTGASPVLDA